MPPVCSGTPQEGGACWRRGSERGAHPRVSGRACVRARAERVGARPGGECVALRTGLLMKSPRTSGCVRRARSGERRDGGLP